MRADLGQHFDLDRYVQYVGGGVGVTVLLCGHISETTLLFPVFSVQPGASERGGHGLFITRGQWPEARTMGVTCL